LRVDVVHELVRWFECEERLAVEVSPPYTDGFFAAHDEGARASARLVLPRLLELVALKSIVDVGCGTGLWLQTARELGVEDVLGLDGEWVEPEALAIPPDRFRSVDLSAPGALERRFDLALSLEVAEHLPPASAERFTAFLTSTAPIVAFSAAVPGQGGHAHLNEQWPSYWADLFSRQGYEVVDCLRELFWDDPRIDWWYAQNLLLFAEPAALDAIAALRDHPRRGLPPLGMVHPRRLSLAT
jgi:SAM-dependent methyltransferase